MVFFSITWGIVWRDCTLAHLHFSSAPVFTESTAVVTVMGPSESKLATVSRRCGSVMFVLPCSLRWIGARIRVPITVLSALFFQARTRSETLLKPACRNWLTAGSVMTMLLAVSSAQDQMKVGARVPVMSRWSLSLVSVGARTEATPMTLKWGVHV